MAWTAGMILTPERTGAWQTWTPTFNDFDPGAGATIIARYAMAGDIVVAYLSVTLGTGFSFSTDPRFSLPIAGQPNATNTNRSPLGIIHYHDGTTVYLGDAMYFPSTMCRLRWPNPSNSNRLDVISSTVPFTWSAGDIITAKVIYEGQ
jgi:hypothetical protein